MSEKKQEKNPYAGLEYEQLHQKISELLADQVFNASIAQEKAIRESSDKVAESSKEFPRPRAARQLTNRKNTHVKFIYGTSEQSTDAKKTNIITEEVPSTQIIFGSPGDLTLTDTGEEAGVSWIGTHYDPPPINKHTTVLAHEGIYDAVKNLIAVSADMLGQDAINQIQEEMVDGANPVDLFNDIQALILEKARKGKSARKGSPSPDRALIDNTIKKLIRDKKYLIDTKDNGKFQYYLIDLGYPNPLPHIKDIKDIYFNGVTLELIYDSEPSAEGDKGNSGDELGHRILKSRPPSIESNTNSAQKRRKSNVSITTEEIRPKGHAILPSSSYRTVNIENGSTSTGTQRKG